MVKTVRDLTALEAAAELSALRAAVGGRADVHASLNFYDPAKRGALVLAIYPNGIVRSDSQVSVHANSWRELFGAGRDRWATYRDQHASKTIRRMALEIIRLTAEIGGCSDAALRGAGFSPEEVTTYAERACQDADEIASNGPFTVLVMGVANAEAA